MSDGKASACNPGDPGSILGLEIPLEKRKATHSSILAWRSPSDCASPWGLKESDTDERLSLFAFTGKMTSQWEAACIAQEAQLSACSVMT